MKNLTNTNETCGRSERENDKLYNNKNNNRRNNNSNNKNKNNTNNSNSNNLRKQSNYRKKGNDDECNFIEHTAQWGDTCVQIDDSDEDTLRVYCQNVNGIFDTDGRGLDEAFHHMRTTKANVFTFNETHGDDTNPEARNVLRRSKQKLWQNQDVFVPSKPRLQARQLKDLQNQEETW